MSGNIGNHPKILEVQRLLQANKDIPIFKRRGGGDRLTATVIPVLLVAGALVVLPSGLWHMYTGTGKLE